jgi:hypothetical protein
MVVKPVSHYACWHKPYTGRTQACQINYITWLLYKNLPRHFQKRKSWWRGEWFSGILIVAESEIVVHHLVCFDACNQKLFRIPPCLRLRLCRPCCSESWSVRLPVSIPSQLQRGRPPHWLRVIYWGWLRPNTNIQGLDTFHALLQLCT